MSNLDPLQIHSEERDVLLSRAVEILLADDRIVAAWLFGSMGRGAADVWSDLDLWIVVANEHIADVSTEREIFLSRLGTLLLTSEAPQNAPPGGAYLPGMYPGAYGPHVVDCYWQPQCGAARPPDTRLLFDKVGVPLSTPVPTERGVESSKQARHDVAFFWMMSTIVGKNIARRRSWEVLNLLSFLWSVTARIDWLLRERTTCPTYRDTPPFPASAEAVDQLAALRGLIADMEGLTERTPALHGAVSSDTVSQVMLYLNTIESLLPT
jgi:predicted nucleotidyltransferase